MILSFHPCVEGDKNIICAGRKADENDRAEIRSADAVILPQGCSRSLYQMARENCPNVFPNFDARFGYPGKIGQIHLFRELNVPHPYTEIYSSVKALRSRLWSSSVKQVFGFPYVLKFDWGGEGENVFLAESDADSLEILQKTKAFEESGQSGFLLQKYIPSQNRALRIAVIGETVISYWRVQQKMARFHASLAKGAVIDFESDPALQAAAVAAVKDFCSKTKINLAGFDLLVSSVPELKEPLFIEINYFFGRRGLGGSKKYYALLEKETQKWIDRLELS